MDEKNKVILIGFEESVEGYETLGWCLDIYAEHPNYKIIIIHVRPEQGVANVLPGEEEVVMNRTAESIIQKVKEFCLGKSVNDMPPMEVIEGDTTTVLIEAAEKYKAYMLVVGGDYGIEAISGPLKGVSLFDANCSVVVRPKFSEDH